MSSLRGSMMNGHIGKSKSMVSESSHFPQTPLTFFATTNLHLTGVEKNFSTESAKKWHFQSQHHFRICENISR